MYRRRYYNFPFIVMDYTCMAIVNVMNRNRIMTNRFEAMSFWTFVGRRLTDMTCDCMHMGTRRKGQVATERQLTKSVYSWTRLNPTS